jgi:hypothetical protein
LGFEAGNFGSKYRNAVYMEKQQDRRWGRAVKYAGIADENGEANADKQSRKAIIPGQGSLFEAIDCLMELQEETLAIQAETFKGIKKTIIIL